MAARRSTRSSKKSGKVTSVAPDVEPESEDDTPAPTSRPSPTTPKTSATPLTPAAKAPSTSKGRRTKTSDHTDARGGSADAQGDDDDNDGNAHHPEELGPQEGDEYYHPPASDHNAELGLAALRDSPEGLKPFYPYSTLIRCELYTASCGQVCFANTMAPFLELQICY